MLTTLVPTRAPTSTATFGLLLAIACFAALPSTSYAANCNGSSFCAHNPVIAPELVFAIDKQIERLGRDRVVNDGTQIACFRNDSPDPVEPGEGICVFPQNTRTGRTTLGQIRDAAQRIVDRGCKVCGSDFVFPNDSGSGEVTFNFVAGSACAGNRLEEIPRIVACQFVIELN
jgi:Kp4